MTSRIGVIEWMTNTNVLKDLILSSMSPEELQSFRSNKENANPQVLYNCTLYKSSLLILL